MRSGRSPGTLALTAFAGLAVAWLCLQLVRYYAGSGVARHHVESAAFIATAAVLILLLILPSTAESDHQRPPGDLRAGAQLVSVLFFCAGALALYAPALTVGLLSDDFVLVDRAARGSLVGHTFVRPVPLVVWQGILTLDGGARAMHALNVLLHGINAALTTALCVRLGARSVPAFLAGVLFLVWPTQVEPVVWAAALPDVLLTTLVLVVVLAWTADAWKTRMGVIAMALLSLIALLTKETAGVLPILVVAIAAVRWRDTRPGRREVVTLGALLLLCAAYLVWRVFIRVSPPDAVHPTVSRYVLKEMLSRTFGGLGVPLPVDIIQANAMMPLLYAFGALFLIVLPILLSRQRRSAHRRVVQGFTWTVAATMLAIGYLSIGPYLDGARYLYLAAAGWCLALTAGVEGFRDLGRSAGVTAAAVVIALAGASTVQTHRSIRDWTRAAMMRDEMLAQASAVAAREHCGTLRASGLPETARGAQVFRNGFAEATRGIRGDGSRVVCDVVWDGTRFHRVPPGSR